MASAVRASEAERDRAYVKHFSRAVGEALALHSLEPARVLVRVRRPQAGHFDEVTLRSLRADGSQTELGAAERGAYDYLFYGRAMNDSILGHYVICRIESILKVLAGPTGKQWGTVVNDKSDRTTFVWVKIAALGDGVLTTWSRTSKKMRLRCAACGAANMTSVYRSRKHPRVWWPTSNGLPWDKDAVLAPAAWPGEYHDKPDVVDFQGDFCAWCVRATQKRTD
jgi:hypothetical protein